MSNTLQPGAFTVGSFRYRIVGKMNAIQQLHVVRRLAPLVSAFQGADLVGLRPEVGDADPERNAAALAGVVGPLAEGVAKLSDNDTEYVLGVCMGLVEREMPGGAAWAPVYAVQAKKMMYDDIGFMELMQIMGRVLMGNIGDFGFALRPPGSGTDGVPPTA